MSNLLATLTFEDIHTGVTLIAHLCTSILGIVAIYGLLKHKSKISAFVRLLAHSVITERVNRIKGTLGELDSLNYDVKEHRKQIIALLGQLTGMVRLFASRHDGFK